jgi:hypothetical protein
VPPCMTPAPFSRSCAPDDSPRSPSLSSLPAPLLASASPTRCLPSAHATPTQSSHHCTFKQALLQMHPCSPYGNMLWVMTCAAGRIWAHADRAPLSHAAWPCPACSPASSPCPRLGHP